MLNKVAENKIHIFRYFLVIGWITIIASLFYDPISAGLTDPNAPFFSPLKDPLITIAKDPATCIRVQGECIPSDPYEAGARIFWGMIVPAGISIIFVLGHETWRRICPLYFLSQIPRKLGLNPKLDIRKNKWLTENHLYLQFVLFLLGITARILFINSARLVFGSFLVFVILSAIGVVFLYGGRSWCHYVCPFGMVQMVFTGPRSLLGSKAHMESPKVPTQSMCRTYDAATGTSSKNCIGCKVPCMDIDAEKAYWEQLHKPGRNLVQYGYLGLVFAYFIYYFLYSGNFDYYFSGAWTHEVDQLANIFKPGFYIGGQKIGIPKLIATPLTFTVFAAVFYFVLNQIEKAYGSYARKKNPHIDRDIIKHRMFTVVTFLSFLGFYVYGGRPELLRLPVPVQIIFNGYVVLVATLWIYRTLGREPQQYKKESIADKLRRQLGKLKLNFEQILNGRSLDDLKPDELDLLAQVLPQVTKQDRLQVYKGVLEESIKAGNVEAANSIKTLQSVRQQLGVSEEEHYAILTESGIENPTLLKPAQEFGHEDRLRVESYRDGVANLLQELVDSGMPVQQAINSKTKQIANLKHEYRITKEEHLQVLDGLFNALRPKAEKLLALLEVESSRYQAINNFRNYSHTPVFRLLRKLLLAKQQLIVTPLLAVLELLDQDPDAVQLAQRTGVLTSDAIEQVLKDPSANWQQRLNPAILKELQPNLQGTQIFGGQNTQLAAETVSSEAANSTLLELLQEPNPITQAASLYALTQYDRQKGLAEAKNILTKPLLDDLVKDTAAHLLGQSKKPTSIIEQVINLTNQQGFDAVTSQQLLSMVTEAQRSNQQITEIMF